MTALLAPPSGTRRDRHDGELPLYGASTSTITGELTAEDDVVGYREVLSSRQKRLVQAMGITHIALAIALAGYLLLPSHLPDLGRGPLYSTLALIGLATMVTLQLLAGVRTWAVAYHARRCLDPVPMRAPSGLRVAVLTTIVPGKEPVEMVMATLRAMKRIHHDGVMDVWLLDEGDDPSVRDKCEEIGVRHFSRKGIDLWNAPSGPFRARTKHGNHNAWRSLYEQDYDVVAQMDPDHVPTRNFLERTLGYFNDPDTAFVVAPQVYGNLAESFVARGSAQLAYLFHGVIQRGANGHDAPLLIGTNHLYRPRAFSQIGGYQDSIIEDHLTSMVVYSEVNPATGNGWKGVYTPDIIAVGEGPATYTDYFSQQKRWAYGIWQIAREHSPRLFRAMPRRHQWASFAALQLHYPTLALSWVGGIFLWLLYLVGDITITQLPVRGWAGLFIANIVVGLAFNQYLRRFNLVPHERKGIGFAGIVLDLLTAPIYVAAAVAQLAGRPLSYVVTAKGSMATRDNSRTFRSHLGWAALAIVAMAFGIVADRDYPIIYFWATLTAVISLTPAAQATITRAAAGLRGDTDAEIRASIPAQRRVGERLVGAGLMSLIELRELLDVQRSSEGPWRRLGDLAVEQGYVTAQEVDDVLVGRIPQLAEGAEVPSPVG